MNLVYKHLGISSSSFEGSFPFKSFSLLVYALSIFFDMALMLAISLILSVSHLGVLLVFVSLLLKLLCVYLLKKDLMAWSHPLFLLFSNLTPFTCIVLFGNYSVFYIHFLNFFLLFLYADDKKTYKRSVFALQMCLGILISLYSLFNPPEYVLTAHFELFFFIGLCLTIYLLTFIRTHNTDKLHQIQAQKQNQEDTNEKLHQQILQVSEFLNTSSTHLSDAFQTLETNLTGIKERAVWVNQHAGQILDQVSTIASASQTSKTNMSSVVENIAKMDATLTSLAEITKIASDDTHVGSELVFTIQNNLNQAQNSVHLLSQSVQNIANELKQIDASLTQINQKCSRSILITDQAKEKTFQAKFLMDDLSMVSNQISTFVNVIKKVTSKTNLLALNAAIEAESAGESGKGFAIVAREVKDLAKQTIQSTHQIENQIEKIQQTFHLVVETVGNIHEIIHEVSQITGNIAVEVNLQSEATTSIASWVMRESNEIAAVNTKINAIADFSVHTSERIKTTSLKVTEIAHSTQTLVEHAHEVSKTVLSSSDEVSHIANLCINISQIGAEIYERALKNKNTTIESNELLSQLFDRATAFQDMSIKVLKMMEPSHPMLPKKDM